MWDLGRKVDVGLEVAELTERLVGQFGDQVPRHVIEETVSVCAAQFRNARVVDFVPVLIERSCRIRLRAAADGASPKEDPPRAGGGGDRVEHRAQPAEPTDEFLRTSAAPGGQARRRR